MARSEELALGELESVLASARQVALAIGTDDPEGHGGAVGDSPQPAAEHGSNEHSVEDAPEVR